MMWFETITQTIKQPVEFCSDVFLLPLGEPHYDSIDMRNDAYVKFPSPSPPGPPTPPRRYLYHPNHPHYEKDKNYYDLLLDKLAFNNNEYVTNVLSQSFMSSSPMKAAMERCGHPKNKLFIFFLEQTNLFTIQINYYH